MPLSYTFIYRTSPGPELEILRWISEDGDTAESYTLFENNDVKHVPQGRYPCLFPHQADAAHDVLEVVPGMTTEELRRAGDEAVRTACVLLCPAPASTCQDAAHKDVNEEVYNLAAYRPVRQITTASSVSNLVDIAPVAICRNSPLRNGCVMFETRRAGGADLQTEIRTTAPLHSLCNVIPGIIWKGRNNPELAIHDSWHGEISAVAQPAVFHCQSRKATAKPTRIYDAHEKIQTEGIFPERYLALSYCWGEWPNDQMLKDKLEELSRRLSIRYFWVDRWCIHQESESDKATEIKRMRDYYTGASGCVVLPGPKVKPFKLVPQHEGALLSAFQQIKCNSEALVSLLDCRWASRVWTLQEALMSRQLIYAVDNQLIDGDYISELAAFLETFAEVYDGDPRDPEWIGGYGCYSWNPRLPTIVYSRQFRMRAKSSRPTIIRTIFGGRQQHDELQATHHGLSMPLEEALTMVGERNATAEEDYIYGILGITERGETVDVEYGISWRTMLAKLLQAGMITERQLASYSVNRLPGMSWLPECGPGYGPFKNIERLAAFVSRPKISWSKQGVVVTGARFEWMEFDYHEGEVFNIHGMVCWLVRGKICFPDIPGLIAKDQAD
ncbi:het domain [Fusarium albosuccineum]|uniref:Het domain n=1 Tax=Fusarium albosuccineum TaxID=1237068 RepID=A0A8H4LHG5_9HYPO|nr:het domain [Fusarium albosuccineum]